MQTLPPHHQQEAQQIWASLVEKDDTLQVIDSCGICLSKNIRAIGIFRDKLCLNRCLQCGVIFLGPRREKNIYKSGHVRRQYIPSAIQRGMLTADEEPVPKVIYNRYRKIADLTDSLSPSSPVADIGCGIGLSMLALKHLGIQSVGYDVNPEFVQQANRFGLDAHLEDIVSKTVIRHEIVTLSSMIEHLLDPVGFLRALRMNTLHDSGHVVITAPNILSVDFIRDGGQVANINGNHFWYFSNRTLSLALDRAGFDVVRVHRETHSVRDPVMMNSQHFLEGFLGIDDNLTGGIGIIARARPLARRGS